MSATRAARVLTALFLIFIVAGPMVEIARGAFVDADGALSMSRWTALAGLREACAVTAGIVIASVVLALAVGAPLALVFGLVDFPARRALAGLLLMPLTLPPLVGALSLRALFHELGMIPALLRVAGWEQPPFLDGYEGVLAVHTLTMYPIVFAFCLAAMARIDAAQLEAARMHGAGGFAALIRVLLPALAPAMAASAALVALTSLSSFTAPYYWKTEGEFLTLVIYKSREIDPDRAVLATFLLSLMAIVVLVLFMLLERRAPAPATRGVPRPIGRRLSSLRGWLTTAVFSALALFVLLPHLCVVVLALATRFAANEPVPGAYGMARMTRLFQERDLIAPLVSTAWMSIVAVAIAIIFGPMAAFWRARGRARVTWAIETVTMLPFALPGTVLALAALAYWNERWALGLLPPLAHTVWLLPLVLAIRILPLAFRATTAALAALDPALEEAAASLGASPARRLTKVILPAIAPSLMAAALLGLLLASGELAASIMLYVPANTPVSVKIDTLFRHSRFGEPFAYATLLIAFQVAVVLAAAWISGRRSGRRRKDALRSRP